MNPIATCADHVTVLRTWYERVQLSVTHHSDPLSKIFGGLGQGAVSLILAVQGDYALCERPDPV